jgi:predicted transcriptional regulator
MGASIHALDSAHPSASPEVSLPRRADHCTSLQPLIASILAQSIAAAGISQQRCADLLGVSRNLVAMWCDQAGGRSIPLHRVLDLALSSRRGRDAARCILTACLSHLGDAESGCQRDIRDDCVALSAGVGGVAATVRDALADDVLTAAERSRIASSMLDVEQICQRARAGLAHGDKP